MINYYIYGYGPMIVITVIDQISITIITSLSNGIALNHVKTQTVRKKYDFQIFTIPLLRSLSLKLDYKQLNYQFRVNFKQFYAHLETICWILRRFGSSNSGKKKYW